MYVFTNKSEITVFQSDNGNNSDCIIYLQQLRFCELKGLSVLFLMRNPQLSDLLKNYANHDAVLCE